MPTLMLGENTQGILIANALSSANSLIRKSGRSNDHGLGGFDDLLKVGETG